MSKHQLENKYKFFNREIKVLILEKSLTAIYIETVIVP